MSRRRHTPADEPHFLIRSLSAELADGRSLEPHAHSWHQLISAGTGVLSVWTAQGSWVAPPHWAIWAPAGVAHAMRATGIASLRTLYVRPDRWPDLPQASAVMPVSALLRELILRVIEVGMLDEREPTHVAIAHLVVHELRAHPTPSFDLPLPRTALLRRVADELAQAPAELGGHAALARRFGLGARTLERGFVAETGLSLGRWRRQARLLHALRQLGAGTPVKQAAAETGYHSASAFVAAFKATFHTTPGRYFETRRSGAPQTIER